jgi:hydroxymethylglutaryl-CoA lyase
MTVTAQVYEVSLRDGLQNETTVLSTEQKLQLIEQLLDAGTRELEVTSFVRPSWVPQLADAEALIQALPQREGVRYWGLVPNIKGLERALSVGLKHISTVLSASEQHNKKNINRTIEQSLGNMQSIINMVCSQGGTVRSYVSTAFGCPYQGEVSVEQVGELVRQLLGYGATQVALGDTIGTARPGAVERMLAHLFEAGVRPEQLSVHFHDTRGLALANAFAAWKMGIRTFDASLAGLGGCPYAPGASGNLATEDLVYLLQGLNACEHLDLDALCRAGIFAENQLGRELSGRYHGYWKSTHQDDG